MRSQLRANSKAILPNGQLVSISYAHFNWDRQYSSSQYRWFMPFSALFCSSPFLFFGRSLVLLINGNHWRWYAKMDFMVSVFWHWTIHKWLAPRHESRQHRILPHLASFRTIFGGIYTLKQKFTIVPYRSTDLMNCCIYWKMHKLLRGSR